MEVKEPKEEKIAASDLRLPEVEEEAIKGPSRVRMILHLTGVGFGFLLLLVGAGLGISRNIWDKLALIPVIAGGALVAGWITMNYRFLSTVVRKRRVLVGTNAVFMAILGVVLLVMANFISNRHYSKWDLTGAQIFTLSQKTEKVLEKLDRDITIIVLRFASLRTGEELTYGKFTDLTNLYKQASAHIKVENLQPDVDPEGAKLTISKYGIDANWGYTPDAVYVVCGDKKKLLRLNQMMQWEYFGDQMNPQRRPVAFKGEQYVTSAIIEVTEARQTKLYFLTGHGERGMDDAGPQGMMALTSRLKEDNMLAESLTGVPTAGVPPDCDCLVIMAPQTALSADEADRIKRYLEKGGRMLLCEDVRQESGLEQLLAGYGVRIGNDVTISTDPGARYKSAATIFVQDFGVHEITAPLKGYRILVDYARSVSAAPGASRKFRVTSLLETTKDSYSETDLDTLFKTQQSFQDAGKDTAGPVSLAVAVEEAAPAPREEEAAPTKEKKLARLAVFGDADLFANYILSQLAPNISLARNTINWLIERKDLIAIESRPELQHILAVDESARKTVFWLLVVGLPLVVLLLGGMVWAFRSYGSRAAKA